MKQIVTVLILIGAALVSTAHAQQTDDSEFLSLSPEARDLFILQEMRSADAAILQEIRSEAKLNEEFRRATRSDIAGLRGDLSRFQQTMIGLFVTMMLTFGGGAWGLARWVARKPEEPRIIFVSPSNIAADGTIIDGASEAGGGTGH